MQDGQTLRFKAANNNTGATTFSPNGIAAVPIVDGNHAALQGGEIAAAGDVWVQWNNSIGAGSWVLVKSSGGGVQVAPATKSQQAISAGQVQTQNVTAFASGGISSALTLAPIPAIAAYVANQRFRIKFGVASTGADTISVSGLSAKSIKQYDPSGAKIAAAFAINQLADIEYDGTDFVLLNTLPKSNTGLPVSFLVSGTYTPTPGMKYLYFEIQGGGGAGGPAAVTSASQLSCGGGGASGSYGRGILTSVQIGSGQAITIGLGGVGSTSNVGSAGGATSIGALATAPGGIGSGAISAGTTSVAVEASAGLPSTGASVINSGGQSGTTGFITGSGVVSGPGAGSGVAGGNGGGNAAGAGQAGGNGTAPGAGGGGSGNNVSTATIRQGGSGANGVVIIWEFF